MFKTGDFRLHSGQSSSFLIDCSTMSLLDWQALAALVVARFQFSRVEGVPRGGLPFAAALRPYESSYGPLLIVDDVLTTGASMEEQRAGRDAIGVVVYTRRELHLWGECPEWVRPIFRLEWFV